MKLLRKSFMGHIQRWTAIPVLLNLSFTSENLCQLQVQAFRGISECTWKGPHPRDLSRVSESTHGLSREFLATLCLSFPCMSVHVSSHRGKLIVGWTLPPETPPEVADAQKKQAQDGFDEVVARSVAHRRPARHPFQFQS